jgi:hypothetical protein
MSVATAEPVVEAEVLTALDFEVTPVEVTEPPVEVVVFKAGGFVIPENLTFTWSVTEPEPPTIAMLMEKVKAGCGCMLCNPPDNQIHTMNPQAKALWVEALRSDRYQQGRGRLRNGSRFCGLGVLVDVAVRAGVRMAEFVDAEGSVSYDGDGLGLPVAVQRWAGLPTQNPFVMTGTGKRSVIDLNDREGLPFEVLADLIEANL